VLKYGSLLVLGVAIAIYVFDYEPLVHPGG
jgi:hypothetical protein